MQQLILEDDHTVRDLTQLMQRLVRVESAEVRLRGEGSRLSVFASTQSPGGLGDTKALVLVHRGVRLSEPLSEPLDVVVETRAVLDRLARLTAPPLILPVPPVNLTAVWAGMLPPRAGWEPYGVLDAKSLRDVAIAGAVRVAEALPENPGQPLVDQARGAVWSLEIAPGVPAAAAFAIDALGFLRGQDHIVMARSRNWLRLVSEHGEVFVRAAQSL